MTSLGRDPERDKWQKHKPTQGTFITLRMGLRIGSYQILRGEKNTPMFAVFLWSLQSKRTNESYS